MVARNCDGSPLAADTVATWPKMYGLVAVTARAMYKGRVNETHFYIAYAPDAYVKAMALAERLGPGAAEALLATVQGLALSGNWGTVAHIVKVGEGARGWPVTEEAVLWSLSNYLESGSEDWLRLAEVLSKHPYTTYVAVVTVALAVAAGLHKRRKQIRHKSAAN